MDSPYLIQHYFPEINDVQKKQFQLLKGIYQEWNQKINVISRKDIDNFYLKHCLHSLGIAKVHGFLPQQKVLDVGTGGGFPGIPLAILFPETKFLLVDSVAKKIKVVSEVVNSVNLTNVSTMHQRVEEVDDRFNFIVSRAVTRMKPFCNWVSGKIIKGKDEQGFANGILYLKGGDLSDEMAEVKSEYQQFPLKKYFTEDFFETKKVVFLPK